MKKPKLLVFASGTNEGGGSGFRKLIESSRNGLLNADIVGVCSNHENGGVRKIATDLKVPFTHLKGPFTAEKYLEVADYFEADYFPLSGWLKPVYGLDAKKTFNIHPGPLPMFGGSGMYGHHVHEAVIQAFKEKKLEYSEINMHFVVPYDIEGYDKGPVFFKIKIKIFEEDTPTTLAKRVNLFEHQFQSSVTNLVVSGGISWDGVNPNSLKFPVDYSIERTA